MSQDVHVVSQNQVVAFVNDAIAMEKNICSLHELSKGLRRKAQQITSEASVKFAKAESSLYGNKGMSDNEKQIREQKKQCEEKLKKLSDIKEDIEIELRIMGRGRTILAMFIYFVLWALFLGSVMAVAFLLIPGVDQLDIFKSIVMILGMGTLLPPEFIIYSICEKIRRQKATKKVKKRQQPKIDALEQQIREIDAKLNSSDVLEKRMTPEKIEYARKQRDKLYQKAQELHDQATACLDKADEIRRILNDCYEQSNIVPPDYRYIDCLVVLQHAFRNGLADNMKEAVLYYEQKEFRQAVIRGVDNVHDMLGQLANTMSEIRGVLNDIDNNVYNVMRNQEINNSIQQARSFAEREYQQAQLAHNKWVKDKINTAEYLYNT